jgi:hypothetical protein
MGIAPLNTILRGVPPVVFVPSGNTGVAGER